MTVPILLPLAAALVLAAAPRLPDRAVARISVGAMSLALAAAIVAFAAASATEPVRGNLLGLDRLGAVMLLLVTGISTVVHSFAARYLDSDPGYRRFFLWLGVVTASVSLVVLANDLIALALGWIGTSVGLYELQVHYRERPAALVAARLMRRSHVVGDVALVVAFLLLAFAAHQTRIDLVLASVATLPPPALWPAVALLTIAAFSKSSQIPLHRWLPQTMEAPTPVSALMHAGIVNGGGFLLARFSPLLAHATIIAAAIVLVGATTALWGTSCMLVRSDVKRGLAYSTVGQMGYMTMQCGLGAFPAAIAHLVAHGIFKATLFLGAGYAIHDERAERASPESPPRRAARTSAAIALVVPLVVAVAVACSPLGRALPAYGWVLLGFAALTCAQAAFTVLRRCSPGELLAVAAVNALLPLYALALVGFDRFLGRDVAVAAMLVPPYLAAAVLALFAVALVAGWNVVRLPRAFGDRVYVWLLSERLPLGVSAW